MYKSLPPAEVKELLASGKARLIDVREDWEHQAVAIPGSVLLPLSRFMHEFEAALPDKNETLIIYCHHGSRSLQVCHFLHQKGYNRLINLDGGVEAWAVEVEPEMPRY